MHDGNCQQLYHTFIAFCSIQVQILKSQNFLELFFHAFAKSYREKIKTICMTKKVFLSSF